MLDRLLLVDPELVGLENKEPYIRWGLNFFTYNRFETFIGAGLPNKVLGPE